MPVEHFLFRLSEATAKLDNGFHQLLAALGHRSLRRSDGNNVRTQIQVFHFDLPNMSVGARAERAPLTRFSVWKVATRLRLA
jgi:hypothetical protein